MGKVAMQSKRIMREALTCLRFELLRTQANLVSGDGEVHEA